MQRSGRLRVAAGNETRAIGGLAFDWVVVAAGAWLIGGAYMDGWAHNHIPSLETFFTPWHGVLYSGFVAVAAVLLATLAINHRRGYSWLRAIPRGYGPSYLGVPVFLLAGLGDMTWHEVFGIEVSIEALVSPTHLMLAAGATLLYAGPFRAAWQRTFAPGENRSAALWPALLSLTYILSVLTFFTITFHPFSRPWAAAGNQPISGVLTLVAPNPNLPGDGVGGIGWKEMAAIVGLVSILLQAAILMGAVLLAVRRWGATLPFGAFTMMFTLNAALVGFERSELIFVPVAFLGGVAADSLLIAWKPSVERLNLLRLYAFVVPAIYYALYFAELQLTGGIWWTVPLWTGSIVYAGVAGLLQSYLIAPLPTAAKAARRSVDDERELAA